MARRFPPPEDSSGYQTPTEDSHPPFIRTAPPTPPTPTPTPTTLTAPPPPSTIPGSGGGDGAGTGRPRPRPALLQLPSYYIRRNWPGGGGGGGDRNDVIPSLDDMLHKGVRRPKEGEVGFRERVACYQWTFFTMTMATGGIANVLHSIPYRAAWLDGAGIAFALLNMLLFVLNCVFISMRFRIHPGSFARSFTDQVESLFIPAFFVSLAIISINICQYGIPNTGPWLLYVMEVIFWIYLPVSVVASSGIYLILWSTQVFPIHMMTPTWVFPAYPMLLTGSFAANLIAAAAASGRSLQGDALGLALGAFTTQGTGCLIAFMISAAFMYRLMTQKLPRDFQRPGVFISIGPFAFTVTGIVQLSNLAENFIPPTFLSTADAILIIRILALLAGLWLYGLSLWFFLVSVGSLWRYVRPRPRPRRRHTMPFRMTWWSFVFPNTALVTATEALAAALRSDGLAVAGCVLAGLLIVVWVCVFGAMVRCFRKRELLWPKDDV